MMDGSSKEISRCFKQIDSAILFAETNCIDETEGSLDLANFNPFFYYVCGEFIKSITDR